MRNKREHQCYETAKLAYTALMKIYPFEIFDLDGEQWREIDENYHISNFGRLKSFKSGKPKILKPTLHTGGYMTVKLQIDGKQQTMYLHRVVAEKFIPNLDNKATVNHRDGNKFNNSVDNLEWATQSENNLHAVKTGLIKSGDKDYRASTTNEVVEKIRALYVPYDTVFGATALAKLFELPIATVFKIVHGERYKTAEGNIHKKKFQSAHKYLPKKIRQEIRRLYKPRDSEFGIQALAYKYGVHRDTIRKILHEDG